MSTTVDQEVVQMRFDNRQFEAGVAQTLNSLENLKESLNFKGAVKGLNSIENVSRTVKLDAVSNAVETVKLKFDALEIIATTSLVKMTNSAMLAGKKIAKALTIELPKDGFNLYEQKINSVQTIVTNTGKSLEEVNQTLAELNEYSNKTIYKFTDMTSNLGKFTAAGIDLKTSTKAIMGISNAAAAAGASTADAGRAMYNISQAYGVGAMKLIDWKSIENANMATKELKETIIKAGVATGSLIRDNNGLIHTLKGTEVTWKTMRETLNEGWFNTETMNTAFGWYANENEEIGKKAMAAAQDVKTLTQMIDVLKESIATGWSDSFEFVIGDFEESKELLTNISNIITGILDVTAAHRNDVLFDWKALGGREALINSIYNICTSLYRVVDSIKQGFNEIFPMVDGLSLYKITSQLEEFTKKLIISDQTMTDIKDTFAGIFSIFDIFRTVALSVVQGMFPMIDSYGTLMHVILRLTGAFGRMLKNLSSYLVKTGAINNAIRAIIQTGTIAAQVILTIAAALAYGILQVVDFIDSLIELKSTAAIFDSIFSILSVGFGTVVYGFSLIGVSLKKFINEIMQLKSEGVPLALAAIEVILGPIAIGFIKAKDAVVDFYKKLTSGEYFKNMLSAINAEIIKMRKSIKDTFENSSLYKALTEIDQGSKNAGFSLEWFSEKLTKFMMNLTPAKILAFAFATALITLSFSISILFGSLAELSTSFKSFFNVLSAFVAKRFLKTNTAKIIDSIAIAIGTLAASLFLISFIDPDNLWKYVTSLSILMGILAGITYLLSSVTKNLTVETMESVAAFAQITVSFVSLAGAVALLAASLRLMDGIDLNGIWTKVAVIGAFAVELGVVAGLMAKFVPQLTKGSLYLLIFSFSISNVVKALGSLKDINGVQLKNSMEALIELMAGVTLMAISTKGLGVGSVVGLLGIIMVLKNTAPGLIELSKLDYKKINNTITDLLKSVMTVSVLAGFMTGLAAAFGPNLNKFSNGLIKITFAVGLLLGLAYLIGNLPDQTAIYKGVTFVETMLIFIGVLEGLSILTANSNMGQFGKSVIQISVSVGLLAFISSLLGDLAGKGEAIREGIWCVTELIGLIALIEMASQFTVESNLKGIFGIIVGLSVIIAELIMLADSIEDRGYKVKTATDSLTQIILSFGLSVLAVNLSANLIKPGATRLLISFVAGLSVLLGGLYLLADQPIENIETALIALCGVIFAFWQVVRSLGGVNINIASNNRTLNEITNNGTNNKSSMIGLILAFGAGLSMVALAMTPLAQQDWNSIINTGIAISMVFAVMAIAVKGLVTLGDSFDGIKMGEISVALIGMTTALMVIAETFIILGNVDWNTISKNFGYIAGTVYGLTMLAGGLIALTMATEGLAPLIVGGLLLSMALSIIAIAGALNLMIEPLNQLDAGKIAKIAGSLALIGLATIYMVPGSIGMLLVADGLLALSAASYVAAKAFEIFEPLFERFINLFESSNFFKVLGNASLLSVSLMMINMPLTMFFGVLRFGTKVIQMTSAAILVLSGGFLNIATSIKILSEVGENGAAVISMVFKELAKSIGYLIVLLPTLFGYLAVLSYNFAGLLALGTFIQFLGVAFSLGALGIKAISDALIALGNAELPNLIDNLTVIQEMLPDFLNNCQRCISALKDFGVALVQVGFGMITCGIGASIIAVSFALIAGAIMGASIGLMLSSVAITMLTTALENLGDVSANLTSNDNFESIVEALKNLSITGISLLAGIVGLSRGAVVLEELASAISKFDTVITDGDKLKDIATGLTNLSGAGTYLAIGTPGMLIGSVGITALATALSKLVIINDSMNINEKLLNICKSLTSLNGVGLALGITSPFIIAGAYALDYLTSSIAKLVAISGAVDDAIDSGMYIIEGVKEGINQSAPGLLDLVANVGASTISVFRQVLGINSPSLAFEQNGMYMMAGGGKGVRENANLLLDPIEDVAEDSIEVFDDTIDDKTKDSGKGLLSNLQNIFKTTKDGVWNSVKEIGNSVLDSFGIEGETTVDKLGNLFATVTSAVGLDFTSVITDIRDVASGGFEDWYKTEDYWFDKINTQRITKAKDAEKFAELMEMQAWVNDKNNYKPGDIAGEYKRRNYERILANYEYHGKEENGADEYTDAISNMMSSIGDATSAGTKELTEFEKFTQSLTTALTKALSGFNKFSVKFDVKTKDITKNIKSQIMGVSSWGDNLQRAAAKGISEPIIKELAELGPEGYGQLAAFLEMTEEEIAEYNELYSTRLQQATDTTNATMLALAKAGNEDALKYIQELNIDLDESFETLDTDVPVVYKAVQAYEDLSESLKGSISQFEQFDFASDKTSKTLITNLKSQINGMSEWATNFMVLARRGLSREVLDSLKDMGTNGYSIVQGFMRMSADELQEYNDLYAKSLTLSDDASKAIIASYALAGDEASQAFIDTQTDIDLTKLDTILGTMSDKYLKIRDNIDKVKETFTSLHDTIKGQINIFEEFNMSTEISGDKMIENMKSQVEGVFKWSENLRTLAERGINDGLLAQLSELGPNGFEKVAAFVDMSDAQLQEANELFAKSLELPDTTTGQIISSYAMAGNEAAKSFCDTMRINYNNFVESGETIVKAIEVVGEQVNEGFYLGVSNTIGMISEAGDLLANTFETSVREALDTHSPSLLMKKIGSFMAPGFTDGVEGSVGEVESAGKQLADAFVGSIQEGLSKLDDILNNPLSDRRMKLPELDMEKSSESAYRISNMINSRRNFNSNMEDMRQKQNESLFESIRMSNAQNNALVDAIKNSNNPITVNLVLEGDAKGVFNLVRQETKTFVDTKGWNPLVNP